MDDELFDIMKKKKSNTNFIRLERGGTVESARISAKESTRRRNRPRRYSGQESTRTKKDHVWSI